ncbi:MAG: hypothetical protein ACLTV6_07860 [Christensenellales bacterium]
MLEETEKIEDYIKRNCGGHIRAAYGCSLGGSFVGLLAARQKIRLDYGILGSSDLDQASPLAAGLQTNLLMPLFYPLVRDGQFKLRLLHKKMEWMMREKGEYAAAFMKMFGGARPYHEKAAKPVLFRPGYAAAGSYRHADGDSRVLRAEDGPQISRTLHAALCPSIA